VTLIDTGPLVAVILIRDPNHQQAKSTLRSLRSAPLVTTWSCLTEAMYLLGREEGHRGQAELWSMVLDESVVLYVHTGAEVRRMEELMRQYSDAPMDLADASLVTLAEVLNVQEIVTFDSHFRVYRMSDGRFLNVSP
jgi:uncharacterized protein